jgi:hypothetical protein
MTNEIKAQIDEMCASAARDIFAAPITKSDRGLAELTKRILAVAYEAALEANAELLIELKCERGIIKQMRQLAYSARAAANTAIYGIEALAMSDENRVAEQG